MLPGLFVRVGSFDQVIVTTCTIFPENLLLHLIVIFEKIDAGGAGIQESYEIEWSREWEGEQKEKIVTKNGKQIKS